ncbi:MAG: hypothetical protein M3R70_05950 [Actinomycetota bacterium]|nr:hypothetical protein [Actinomycetota bacterium]
MVNVHARAREESGFGLIELLMAVTILNIGIFAIFAAFNTGVVTIKRASEASTASVLADQQMELLRAVTYDKIALDTTLLGSTNNTYKCDSALGTGSCPYSTSGEVTMTCSPVVNTCNPWRTTTGPDHRSYVVATYVLTENPSASARTVKKVTVVVRDSNITTRVLARATSTFDCSTGQPYSSCPPS